MPATEMRKTGVNVVGDVPWGTHFYPFYETRADLLETIVSYCKAGLENHEFCLWVVWDWYGVPISRPIIEPHGGHLWAAGASGLGATFQFTLPAAVAVDA
jgi:hypothetical protein